MPQLLTEEDMRELDSLNSESGVYWPSGARFSKVLIVFREKLKSTFMFTVFAVKIKVSIILKMTR